MLAGEQFQISFSGLNLRFTQPQIPFELSEAFSALRSTDGCTPDAEYEIVLLDHPLIPTAPLYHSYCGTKLYKTADGWLHIYPLQPSENGCQIACLLRPSGKHTLYYPSDVWSHYSRPLYCAHLLGLEAVLLTKKAFLLHSSVVMLNGRTVLFVGASGVGKSTQARLWHQYLGPKFSTVTDVLSCEKMTAFTVVVAPWQEHPASIAVSKHRFLLFFCPSMQITAESRRSVCLPSPPCWSKLLLTAGTGSLWTNCYNCISNYWNKSPYTSSPAHRIGLL